MARTQSSCDNRANSRSFRILKVVERYPGTFWVSNFHSRWFAADSTTALLILMNRT
jgi:hypothetical protein